MSTRGGDPDLSFDAREQGTKKMTKQAKTDAPAKITWQDIVMFFKEVNKHQHLREKWVSDEAWVGVAACPFEGTQHGARLWSSVKTKALFQHTRLVPRLGKDQMVSLQSYPKVKVIR
jgi:hypothetical protein